MIHSAQPSQLTPAHILPPKQIESLQALASVSSDAMLVVISADFGAPEVSIVFANEAFARLTGYSSAEAIGQPLTFLASCTAQASTVAPVWQGIAEGRAITQPWRCIGKLGWERDTELSLIPMGGESGVQVYLLNIRPLAKSNAARVLDSAGLANIQNFIDSLQMGILVLDAKTTVVAINRLAQSILTTYFASEFQIGEVLSDTLRSLLGESFTQNFDNALRGEFVRSEVAPIEANGQTFWYEVSYTPLFDETGQVPFVALVGHNITSRKQSENALELSLHRYHLATENAKAGVWDWDLVSGELYVDPSARAIMGYTEDDFASGMAMWEATIYPPDRDYVIELTNAHLAGMTEEFRAEYRVLHKDGSLLWVLATAKVSRDKDNRPIRLAGTSLDINERKKVEAALRTTEGRFQAVWEASPDAMSLTDADGNFILANSAFYKLTGFSSEQVIGQSISILFPEDLRARLRKEYLETFEEETLRKHIITKIQTANGQMKSIESAAEFVRQEGQPVAIFFAIRDVSDRIATEEALKRHARQAEALARCSQLLLRPAADLAAQKECLRATLVALLDGLEAEYLGLCKFTGVTNHISASFCIEIVAPELYRELISAGQIPLSGGMRLSPELLQRMSEEGAVSATADDVTTGILTGTFQTYNLAPLSTANGIWGFLTFGKRAAHCEWKSGEEWFILTAVEMIGNVLQRWEAEEAVRSVQATLEQQVQQRTAMLFQTVQSLQHQIVERRRAEVEVRRRLRTESTLRDISDRLMRETDFHQAAAATLADIGEKLMASQVVLLRLQPVEDNFIVSHRWLKIGDRHTSYLGNIAGSTIARLLKYLQKVGYLSLSDPLAKELGELADASVFQKWYANSLLILPLHVSHELVGLLICCDSEQLQTEREEALHFAQAAVAMLSGMLRIDQMMNALELRLAEQTEELSFFFNMAVLASGSEHMTETLAAALTMVKEIGNCDAICVHILSPDGAALQLAYQVGLEEIEHKHLLRLPSESTLFQLIQRTSTPILITERNPTELEARLDEFQTYICAPMVVRGHVQGLLSCYWRSVQNVSLNQMSLLTALTDQLGIILENQRLHRQAQQVGMVHERQRLARELHDSVTQSMYSVMLFARAGREALEDNALDRLADCMTQVEGSSLRSLKEMRLLLYQLRPLALEGKGVVEAIRERLELVERRLGIEVDMQMTTIIGLSHREEETLYHVAMEALNNVLKHADADRVAIQLYLAGDQAELCVSDDGIGFNIDQMTHGMGLNNMRDRIQTLGGDLQIVSHIDEGTRVLVRIPVA